MVEQGGPKTIKFEGKVQGIHILILLDKGATHNFISKKLVESLGLKAEARGEIRIRLGNGYKVKVSKQCLKINLAMGEFEFQISTLVLDIGNLDLILGIEWLRTLGEVWID